MISWQQFYNLPYLQGLSDEEKWRKYRIERDNEELLNAMMQSLRSTIYDGGGAGGEIENSYADSDYVEDYYE